MLRKLEEPSRRRISPYLTKAATLAQDIQVYTMEYPYCRGVGRAVSREPFFVDDVTQNAAMRYAYRVIKKGTVTPINDD